MSYTLPVQEFGELVSEELARVVSVQGAELPVVLSAYGVESSHVSRKLGRSLRFFSQRDGCLETRVIVNEDEDPFMVAKP